MDRPFLTIKEAADLAKDLFGVHVDLTSNENVKEFECYDDRNFYINGSKDGKSEEYLLKIYGSCFSEDLVHAIIKVMLFVHDAGIVCPLPLKSMNGDYVVPKILPQTPKPNEAKKAKLETKNVISCFVCFFTFLPGKTLKDFKVEGNSVQDQLFYEVGELTGNLCNALKDMKCTVLEKRKFHWDLYYFDSLLVGTNLLSASEKELVNTVKSTFKTQVKPKLAVLPKQCIHGDINDGNILVEKLPHKFTLSGIIDFGDVNYTCRVFEIAIAAGYMTTVSVNDPIKAAAYTVAGFNSICPLTQDESDLILYCIQARLCQSRCFGAHTIKLFPENANYLLHHSLNALEILKSIMNVTKEEFDKMWRNICKE